MNQVHDFATKLAEGEKYEKILDDFFFERYKTIKASSDLQKLGIDRIWCDEFAVWASVEYKADSRAAETGNAFIEVESVVKEGVSKSIIGWARKSIAQLLIYFIPPTGKIIVVDMLDVKRKLHEWIPKFGIAESQNKDYHSEGILVPLSELEGMAKQTYFIERDKL